MSLGVTLTSLGITWSLFLCIISPSLMFFLTQEGTLHPTRAKQCGVTHMETQLPALVSAEKEKKMREGKVSHKQERRRRRCWRWKSSFFTFSVFCLYSLSCWKKLEGIFSFFFPCGKMERLTLCCPPCSHVLFYFLCLSLFSFSHSSILPVGHSHSFHFIHTFPRSLDSFPAPLATA